MKQFVLDHLNSEFAKIEGAKTFAQEDQQGDLHVQLKNGKRIAVYVINRALRLPEIREKYECNTGQRIHSLFIVDHRLLPADGAQAEAAYWIQALHALAKGRIYAYECVRRECSIRPVHIDWKWGAATRQFQYGPSVNVCNLRTETVEVNSKYIVGVFAGADFGDTPFWQRRTPGDDVKGQKYSWRNFSFRSEKKQQPPPNNQRWDDWDSFQENYGEFEDEGYTFDWENIGRDQANPGRNANVLSMQHYAVLGVNLSASFEEVKRAYRRKAREYHPDLHPPHKKTEYTAKMAEINAAFEAIKKMMDQD